MQNKFKNSSLIHLIYHPQISELLSVRYLYFHFMVYPKNVVDLHRIQIKFIVSVNESHKHEMIESKSYKAY